MSLGMPYFFSLHTGLPFRSRSSVYYYLRTRNDALERRIEELQLILVVIRTARPRDSGIPASSPTAWSRKSWFRQKEMELVRAGIRAPGPSNLRRSFAAADMCARRRFVCRVPKNTQLLLWACRAMVIGYFIPEHALLCFGRHRMDLIRLCGSTVS